MLLFCLQTPSWVCFDIVIVDHCWPLFDGMFNNRNESWLWNLKNKVIVIYINVNPRNGVSVAEELVLSNCSSVGSMWRKIILNYLSSILNKSWKHLEIVKNWKLAYHQLITSLKRDCTSEYHQFNTLLKRDWTSEYHQFYPLLKRDCASEYNQLNTLLKRDCTSEYHQLNTLILC